MLCLACNDDVEADGLREGLDAPRPLLAQLTQTLVSAVSHLTSRNYAALDGSLCRATRLADRLIDAADSTGARATDELIELDFELSFIQLDFEPMLLLQVLTHALALLATMARRFERPHLVPIASPIGTLRASPQAFQLI